MIMLWQKCKIRMTNKNESLFFLVTRIIIGILDVVSLGARERGAKGHLPPTFSASGASNMVCPLLISTNVY